MRNLERASVPRSVAMKLTGHKTESIYRRYAIVSEADLADGMARVAALDRGRAEATSGTLVAQIASETPKSGAPGGNRTPDRRIRNPLLYPSELQAHNDLAWRPSSRAVMWADSSPSGRAWRPPGRCPVP